MTMTTPHPAALRATAALHDEHLIGRSDLLAAERIISNECRLDETTRVLRTIIAESEMTPPQWNGVDAARKLLAELETTT